MPASIPLTSDEMKDFTVDMDALLLKHNCEIGVVSTIKVMKRIDKIEEVTEEDIKSPYVAQPNNGKDSNKA